MKADIILEIAFNLNEPKKTIIKTNAKKEALEEILETWISCQMGKGADTSKPAQKDVYAIKIYVDLTDDSFVTESDTGNKGLTCGIIMNVFSNLKNITVQDLS